MMVVIGPQHRNAPNTTSAEEAPTLVGCLIGRLHVSCYDVTMPLARCTKPDSRVGKFWTHSAVYRKDACQQTIVVDTAPTK